MNIEYPLSLASDFDEIRLANDVSIRRIDDASRARIMGIENVVLDERGRLKSCTGGSEGWVTSPEIDQYAQLYSSNYVASVPTPRDASDLNFALKLLGPSYSSLFIGHQEPGTKHFLSPPCYYGNNPLKIGKAEEAELAHLLSLKRSTKDPKLELIAEIFLYAMSVAPRAESRFVELSIVLEMLLLPSSSTELSYRFALRMAKLLAKHWREDPNESFELGREIYRTRSRLVHAGRDENLSQIASKLENTVRLLVTKYLSNPELFRDNALDALCVSG